MNLTPLKNWKTVPAEEFCLKVADGTHDSPKQSEEGKLLVTSKNIKNGVLDLSSSYLISLKDFEDINKRSRVDQWDVLFSMIGTVGEVCVIKEEPDFAIKNVGLFKCGDKTKALFLYYFLTSMKGKEIALSFLNGTTQKYITLGELRTFPISVPESVEEQKEIAVILGSLDDKIELLRRENKTLESIAQTLFKEWFLDFKFPGSNGKMIDSELGLIPEGWKVGKLGDGGVCEHGERAGMKALALGTTVYIDPSQCDAPTREELGDIISQPLLVQ
jgi:type I restriction enzyme S subunit